MILVTGGAGFIGSTLVKALNNLGKRDIVICDNLERGMKLLNLTDLCFDRFIDKSDLWEFLKLGPSIETIYHLGACSSTTEWDGKYLYRNNFEYSKDLMLFADRVGARFIYASSASVYGLGEFGFEEKKECERPINAYAASKLLFDNYVRKMAPHMDIKPVGLRYFNVYGPREKHKERMSSTVHIFSSQIKKINQCNLFGEANGYSRGAQLRDFVSVDDCVNLNIWFAENNAIGGIFNVGTGAARTFNEVADILVQWFKEKKGITANVGYIDFPNDLLERYQFYTKADLTSLLKVNCPIKFSQIEYGIPKTLNEIYANV